MNSPDFAQTSAINRYRRTTAKHASCAGITAPAFVCVCCKQPRAVAGRRQAVKGTSRFGYVCAGCQR